jgi:hypothetical protein
MMNMVKSFMMRTSRQNEPRDRLRVESVSGLGHSRRFLSVIIQAKSWLTCLPPWPPQRSCGVWPNRSNITMARQTKIE